MKVFYEEIYSYLCEANKLNQAKQNKDDEFYTYLKDVAKEMQHYDFSGKVVYCCCDNPEWSNVYKYFYENFTSLGLRGLISSHYEMTNKSYATYYDGINTRKIKLDGNGDVLSSECKRLAENADILVTNPPFSLFLKIVDAYKHMPFIMLCIPAQMASSLLLPLFKSNKIHYGYTTISKFYRPNDEDDKRITTCWYTNLPVIKKAELIQTVPYNETEFEKYDNFDAVNTDSSDKIPEYDGLIGVPISILTRIDQNNMPFEIITAKSGLKINGKEKFKRLIIRLK